MGRSRRGGGRGGGGAEEEMNSRTGHFSIRILASTLSCHGSRTEEIRSEITNTSTESTDPRVNMSKIPEIVNSDHTTRYLKKKKKKKKKKK